jgi:hypothetical protein
MTVATPNQVGVVLVESLSLPLTSNHPGGKPGLCFASRGFISL